MISFMKTIFWKYQHPIVAFCKKHHGIVCWTVEVNVQRCQFWIKSYTVTIVTIIAPMLELSAFHKMRLLCTSWLQNWPKLKHHLMFWCFVKLLMLRLSNIMFLTIYEVPVVSMGHFYIFKLKITKFKFLAHPRYDDPNFISYVCLYDMLLTSPQPHLYHLLLDTLQPKELMTLDSAHKNKNIHQLKTLTTNPFIVIN